VLVARSESGDHDLTGDRRGRSLLVVTCQYTDAAGDEISAAPNSGGRLASAESTARERCHT